MTRWRQTKAGGEHETPPPFAAAYSQLTAEEIGVRLRRGGLSLPELKWIEDQEARHHRRPLVFDTIRTARCAIVHGHRTASF